MPTSTALSRFPRRPDTRLEGVALSSAFSCYFWIVAFARLSLVSMACCCSLKTGTCTVGGATSNAFRSSHIALPPVNCSSALQAQQATIIKQVTCPAMAILIRVSASYGAPARHRAAAKMHPCLGHLLRLAWPGANAASHRLRRPRPRFSSPSLDSHATCNACFKTVLRMSSTQPRKDGQPSLESSQPRRNVAV
jgi:hypothetical protein